jgi:tetratricopeptide (TPR) repeat protein
MPQESPSPQGFRILVIVSRPLDLPDLPNLADQWALQDGLRRVQAPAFLKMLRPPTVEGLRSEILSGYDIIHFDGHGALGRRCPNCGALHSPQEKKCDRCTALLEDEVAKGYFAFEREDGKLDALAAEELAEIVMSAPNPAKLVFLSACESANGGETSLQNVLLAKGVPAVLGMNESVPLKATMALAGPFYAGLGAGMTIARAFENALPALKRLENGSEQIPVLVGPGRDAKILPAKVTGKASFEAERLFGLPEHEFVGDYIRGDPPRGRKGLLSQTMDVLQSGEKLVVLTGQGGIGKTVLAAEAARRLACRFPGGVFWRSAAEMERLGLEEMLNAFDNVLGPQIRTLPPDTKRDQVLGYLRNYDTSSLLVVDNADSIKDTNLWRFLEGIPQPSAALVTTRESLPCGGREIRVPEMEPEEAGRLLITEARRRSPKWGEHLNQADLECLNEIARFMQGHPLAIKLIAALIASRSLVGIRDELRRNPPKGVSERFDISYINLTERQMGLFCRLAVFSGSMTEEAVGSICIEEDQEDRSDWQRDLGELVRKSFLDRIEIEAQDESGSQVTLYRYKLHLLMRQYAASKAGDELLARIRSRAAKYYFSYVNYFKNNFFMLELEKENVLLGMDWAISGLGSSKDEERKIYSQLILEFMAALDNYLDTRGYWIERWQRTNQAIKATEILRDKKNMSNGIQHLANICQKMGNYIEAYKLYHQSLGIFQELGDRTGVAGSLHNLSILAQATGKYSESRKLCQQSLEIFQELGDKSGVAGSLQNLGILAISTGNYEEARGLFKRSIEVYQELGDKKELARLLHHMSIMEQNIGEHEEAYKLCQQSLKIFYDIGDKSSIAKSLHQMGMLAEEIGEYEEAFKFCQQSLKIFQELGDKNGMSLSLHQMGMLAQDVCKYEKAYKLFQQSLEIAQELGDKSEISKLLNEIGRLAQAKGDCREARKLYQQSLKISQEIGDKNVEARSLNNLGMLAQDTGECEEARKLYQKSLEIKHQLGDKSGVSSSLHNLGMLAQEAGEYEEAQRLYQQSLKISQELHNKEGVSKSLHNLGNLAKATGEYEEARNLFHQSLKISQELGEKNLIASSQAEMALLEEKMGNPKAALQLILQAEAAFLELGSPHAKLAAKVRQRLEQNQ